LPRAKAARAPRIIFANAALPAPRLIEMQPIRFITQPNIGIHISSLLSTKIGRPNIANMAQDSQID
jgi:hypothetical protein